MWERLSCVVSCFYDEEDEEECLEIRKNAEILEDGQTDCSHNHQSSVSLRKEQVKSEQQQQQHTEK